MPIYAYRCQQCGHQQDVLQKLSDPILTTCPACSQETFSKKEKEKAWKQTLNAHAKASPTRRGVTAGDGEVVRRITFRQS